MDQGLAFTIIGVTIAGFVWGRLPYDLVAMLSLLVAVLTGLVPMSRAFEGFSDDVVIIIGAALVISTAIARCGVIETMMHPLLTRLRSVQAQVPVLVLATGMLSMICKNVGALAILMPTAFQLARRGGRSPSALLMPMAFASLLGGLVTLIGTSPNILIAKVRQDLEGKPFGMFDYTPVGLTVASLGFAFLAFGYRLVPPRRPAGGLDAAFTIEPYVTEASMPASSPLVGRTVAELEAAGDGDVTVGTIIRERFRRTVPAPASVLAEGDVLLLEGEQQSLERLVSRARLVLTEAGTAAPGREPGPASVVEGIVTGDSPLLGLTSTQAALPARHGVDLIALSRSGDAIRRRLSAVRFRQGDVVVFKGASKGMSDALGDLRVLPLAERRIELGSNNRSLLPVIILLVAMALAAMRVVSPGVAFFGAAVLVVLLRFLTPEEAYHSIEWHVLVLLGALIPVSHAVQTTGGTDLIARELLSLLQDVPPPAALAVVLVITMIVTPFLHNAPTVLMLGPVAGTLAIQLHLNPDAFLMAVALGAGCDFLTPIGHQCNTLVYAPGGYRFGDYWRLGLPLSVLVVAVGVPMISLVWGLRLP